MLGTGIFIVPSTMARQAGSVPLVMLAWVVGGLLALFGALSYAELAAAMPEAGGQYAYMRRAFGERAAFLFGWTTPVLVGPASGATIATGLLQFAAFLSPGLLVRCRRRRSVDNAGAGLGRRRPDRDRHDQLPRRPARRPPPGGTDDAEGGGSRGSRDDSPVREPGARGARPGTLGRHCGRAVGLSRRAGRRAVGLRGLDEPHLCRLGGRRPAAIESHAR